MTKTLASGAIITFVLAACVSIFSVATVASAQSVVPTCSIYSTASSGSGQPVTISWNSTNATYAFLNPGASVATNGSQIVYPTVTTTYTLTVNGSQGHSSNCQVTVQVGSTSGMPYCTITAGTTNLSPGSAVTLNWNSSNATSASLTNVGSVSASASQVVYPYVTTTYTLTVNNAQGQSANCQTTVYVGTSSTQAPSCWITISNNNQYNNQQATLSWGSTNATSASITPNVGSISTSGSQTVYPTGNQAYVMTVYNAQGQSATCQTSSYVQPGALSCTITANPLSIQNGNSSYLSWTSTGATTASLSDGLGNVAPNGSLTVRPESSRNYTLTVTGSNGAQTTCNTYLTVSGSYVHLNQIPYTGFDFGPIGNTLYWVSLALFAVAGGYLIVYFLPGRKAGMPFARLRSSHAQHVNEATIISERITVPALFANEKPEFITEVSTHSDIPEDLPTFRS